MSDNGGLAWLQAHYPGLARAALSVDYVLDDIRRMLETSRLARREDLIKVFSFAGDAESPLSVVDRTTAYLRDRGTIKLQAADISASSLGFGTLEDTLIEVHRALRWSERKSSLQWWIDTRLRDLGVHDLLVIASPGSARTFQVERVSSLAKALEQFDLRISLDPSAHARAARLRILTVPFRDGADIRWHPISLGHELAHLKYTDRWVEEIVASTEKDQYADGTAEVFAIAYANQKLNNSAATTEHWYTVARDWLKETACDAALYAQYGNPGLTALATYLEANSTPGPKDSHPAPDARLLVARGEDVSFAETAPADGNNSISWNFRCRAYRIFAPRIRQAVLKDLQSIFHAVKLREDVEAKATQRLIAGEPPNSADWPQSDVRDHLPAIEAGLVACLWSTNVQLSEPVGGQADAAAISGDLRVQQATDFLQLQHRFLHVAPEETDNRDSVDLELVNTLHVSAAGVASADGPGRPSRDIRLGRHFIVFKRNAAVTLDATTGSSARRVQELVEIGWGERFVLHPNEMVLAVTLEYIVMSMDCNAQVLSRSSLGRMGLLSATAVHVQPGFRGCLTLELVNLASIPLEITPGQRIAQIVASPLCGAPGLGYVGKYQDQGFLPRFSEINKDAELSTITQLRRIRYASV